MCDYSLHLVSSRPAKVGDQLVTTSFAVTTTRGFVAVGEPDVAVCLLPGTEVAFERDVQRRGELWSWFREKKSHGMLARFRQINVDQKNVHHDALEFADGTIVLLTNLRAGQKARVLQLPPDHSTIRRFQEPERACDGPVVIDAVATWIDTPFGF
jgi:hypothetical protein